MRCGLQLLVLAGLYVSVPVSRDAGFVKAGKNDLLLLIMGDTQYHFKCEASNQPCKERSKRCREAHHLDYYLRSLIEVNETMRSGQMECTKLESRYANRIQRQALEKVIYTALIIDGDLTDFGHMEQFTEFQNGWMNSFPIPILAGLGNHDYENNVDDCMFNFCAHSMLTWFTNYGKNMSLNMDYDRDDRNTFDIKYKGSFAYATRKCSLTGKNCAHILQMNNAVDYETEFSSLLVDWKITSGMEWLKDQLNQLADIDQPILIHMHQNEGVRTEKLKEMLGDWIYENRRRAHKPRVAVFFAHMHALHEVKSYCFHGIAIPFVYVGSVPNNRFSMLRMTDDGVTIFGWAARESGARLLSSLDDMWAPCNRSNMHIFAERMTSSPFYDY